MREFFKYFLILSIPALIIAIGGNYIARSSLLPRDESRILGRAGATMNQIGQSTRSAIQNDIRTAEVSRRLQAGGAGFLHQLKMETQSLFALFDRALRRGLSTSLGWSAAAIQSAVTALGWFAFSLLALMVILTVVRNFAPPHWRQRIIAGGSGVQARSGGVFELPH